MKIHLFADNVVAFRHACNVLENFDPLDFPPTDPIEVKVFLSNHERTYFFPQDRFSFLKEQVSLLDGIRVRVTRSTPEDGER